MNDAIAYMLAGAGCVAIGALSGLLATRSRPSAREQRRALYPPPVPGDRAALHRWHKAHR